MVTFITFYSVAHLIAVPLSCASFNRLLIIYIYGTKQTFVDGA